MSEGWTKTRAIENMGRHGNSCIQSSGLVKRLSEKFIYTCFGIVFPRERESDREI